LLTAAPRAAALDQILAQFEGHGGHADLGKGEVVRAVEAACLGMLLGRIGQALFGPCAISMSSRPSLALPEMVKSRAPPA
jgi:hypothetical protein